ncbi:hypothetical protein ACFWP0_06185 [Achromobacter sp. NPDC058515]|uniref:hypothetical protein n=1 Tax=Achromobacter sp. NPDC058515 TaxID=3346533 RepID=UPI00365F9380
MPHANPQSIATQTKAAIYLEGWGMPAEEVLALARTLQALLPSLDWHAGDAPVPGALTLFLVDAGNLAGDTRGAVWNTFGPVEAMRQAREAGVAAVAVCRGGIGRLPLNRVGVWVATAAEDWAQKLQSLVRALAALQWEPRRGYQDVAAWRGLAGLTQANLLAVTASSESAADFAGLLRQACSTSLLRPAALSVAGVPRAIVDRTLVEAGMQDTELAAVAPMTLDGVLRVDALLGFPWPLPDQAA